MANGDKTRVSGGLFGSDYWVIDKGGGREEVHEMGTFGGVGDKIAEGSPTAMGGYRLTDSSGNSTTDYGLRGVSTAQEAANTAGRISSLQAKGASSGASSASSGSSYTSVGGGYGGNTGSSSDTPSCAFVVLMAFIGLFLIPFLLAALIGGFRATSGSQQVATTQSMPASTATATSDDQALTVQTDPVPVDLQATTLVKLKVSHVKGDGPLYVTEHLDNRYLSVNDEIKTWENIKIVPKVIHVKLDNSDWVKVLSPVKGYVATSVIRIPIYETRSKKSNVVGYAYYNDRVGVVPGTMKDGWVQIGEPYWGWIYTK